MENKDWLNDTTALKKVSMANAFIVPKGYFDNLSDRIVSYKNLNELKSEAVNGGFAVPENYFEGLESNILSRVNIDSTLNVEGSGFTVPGDYFDNLTEQIQGRIFIEEALGEAEAPFAVPDGYFDNLAEQIQSRVFIEEVLNEQQEAFTVPDGYFNNLTEQIQNRVFIEEELGEPDMSFGVPVNYFDQLNAAILDKTANADKIRRKGVVRRLFASTAFKYATAACFALAIGGGILISKINDPVNVHNRSYLHKQLSDVPIDEIKNYLQLNVDAGDTQQTVVTEGVAVDSTSLKDALQSDIDSVQ